MVEVGAERDQLPDGVGTFGDQDAYGVGVAGAGTRDQGVPLVLVRVSPGPSAAAMPPCAHWVEPGVEDVLGDHQDGAADGLQSARIRRAAVRPAMPEPTTTTSERVVQPGAGALSRRGRDTQPGSTIGLTPRLGLDRT